MNTHLNRRHVVAASLLAAAHLPRNGLAAGYPTQPIKLVVPFAPGGSTDLAARLVAEFAARELGQPVVVDNRAGAGGSLGTEVVAKARADGYTLGMATVSTHGANPAIYAKRLKYDPVKDFSPIVNIATTPSVFMVSPKNLASDMRQFVALARANPGRYSYATPGAGSLGHANMEYFASLADIKLLHVPYKGAGPAMNDALAGLVDVISDNLPTALPHIRAGRLKALAVTADRRSPALPDVPTYAELGFPQMGSGGWFGLVAPAGTPAPIVAQLNAAVRKAMANPAFMKKLEEIGATPVAGSPADFARQIRETAARYQNIVKVARIAVD
jgi:tripartite-type tricarboxylate transporter receptor subunit TctC